jgi:phage terminase large subunit-like protein
MGEWDACNGQPSIDPDRPCVVGVDAAPKRDLTAVVLGQLDDARRIHVRCWTFQADPEVGWLDFDLVEGLIRDLAREFWVARVVVDPFAMIRSMMTLAGEGLPVEDFPQQHARMVPASMGLRDAVVERRLVHGGDPALTAAARDAGTQDTSFGWRLVKPHAAARIDPLIALAMVVRILDLDESLAGVTPTVLVV